MVDKVFKFVTARFVVRSRRAFPLMVRYLRAFLRERCDFIQTDKLSDAVAMAIVEEAYRRAAAKEQDGRARYGGFDREIERAADEIVAAFQGAPNVDPRVKTILMFNGLI